MATATPVTVSRVEPNAKALEELRDGLSGALQAMDTHHWDNAYDALEDGEHTPDAVFAFEPITEAVIAEVGPAVLQMLADALNRRLPWTWDPER